MYLISIGALFAYLVYRYGLLSFPSLFVSQIVLYLVVMPLALNGVDDVTGAHANMTWRFPVAVLLYTVFFLMGMRVSAPLAFKKGDYFRDRFRKLEMNRAGSRVAYAGIALLAAAMIAYSLTTRNVFTRGQFLFTIHGFDLALILYLIGRTQRPTWLNTIWFIGLIPLFVFAGLRYRILILFFAEGIPFAMGRSRIFHKFALILGVFGLAIILGTFGQVRSYGSFSITEVLDVDLDLRSALLASGEQTVSISTIAVIENHETLPAIGFEPIILVATQFIPSAIFPNKPRASYLAAYNKVTTGLRRTGTAMHDAGQATLMFGLIALPFSAGLLGLILGFFLNMALKRSPNIHYAIALMVLFGISMPSRGYFAQQVTWALIYLLPLVILQFSGRLVIGPRQALTTHSWRKRVLASADED